MTAKVDALLMKVLRLLVNGIITPKKQLIRSPKNHNKHQLNGKFYTCLSLRPTAFMQMSCSPNFKTVASATASLSDYSLAYQNKLIFRLGGRSVVINVIKVKKNLVVAAGD